MDSSLRAELDALRLRAYGRSADLALDLATVHRLQELEARAREHENHPNEPVEADAAPDGSRPLTYPGDAATASSPTTSEVLAADVVLSAETHANTRVRRPWLRPSRIMLMLWSASVAVSAAVAAIATYTVVGILPVAVVNDAAQIATLTPDSTVTVPVGFFGAEASSATYEWNGLTLFETPSNVTGYGGGGDCFTVVQSSDVPERENAQGGFSTSGPFYSGCRVGNFPATITLPVDSAAPPELRQEFADRALQLVKDGDRIGVFLGGTTNCPDLCTPVSFEMPPL